MTGHRPYYDEDGIQIWHGDCRQLDAWDIAGGVMVTDPPYGIAWRSHGGGRGVTRTVKHDGIAHDDDVGVRDEVLRRWGDRPAMVFGSFRAPPPARVAQVLVWHKGGTNGVIGATTGFRRDADPIYLTGRWPVRPVEWSSVVRSVRGSWNDEMTATGHPHTKPVDLMKLLVHRAPPGTVVDPFMGSGTTLRAAKDLGRPAIGVEVDERYCEIAARRLAQGVLGLEIP
jgi:hypothetical protein